MRSDLTGVEVFLPSVLYNTLRPLQDLVQETIAAPALKTAFTPTDTEVASAPVQKTGITEEVVKPSWPLNPLYRKLLWLWLLPVLLYRRPGLPPQRWCQEVGLYTGCLWLLDSR